MRGVLRAVIVAASFAVAGCGQFSSGAFIEGEPAARRLGVLELRWRRSMTVETVFGEHRPVHRGTPAFDHNRGIVFVGSAESALVALRASDASVVWTLPTLGAVDASPTVYGDDVFVGSADGALYAVDARTGTLRWRFATNAQVVHAPIATEESVYFVNSNDTVFAVSRTGGVQRWRYRRPAPGGISLSGHAGLAASGRRLYSAFSDGTVACIDSTDGSVLWTQDTARETDDRIDANDPHQALDVDTTPLVIGDMVYVASFSAGLFAFDAAAGGQRWHVGELRDAAGLGSDGRHLFVAAANHGLWKIDALDGRVLWRRQEAFGGAFGAVYLGEGLLAVPTTAGALHIARTTDGAVIDGLRPGGGFSALPSVFGPRLFVESNYGTVYALSLNHESAARR